MPGNEVVSDGDPADMLTDWEHEPDWWSDEPFDTATVRQAARMEIAFWVFAFGLEIALACTLAFY